MQFYNIKDSYIDYLRAYDRKVAENKSEKRPYVGIVLEIGDTHYFAPFSSPKPKHVGMKNAKDFRKIAGGSLGVINFNNMIPVPESALLLIDIDSVPDRKYQRLLRNQAHAIAADEDAILRTARALRDIIFAGDDTLAQSDRRVKARCCNLPVLEQACAGYVP